MSDPQRPGDPLDLEQQVCFGLSMAARAVVGAYRPLLEPLGLTHPQYLVMVALWQQGPLSVKALGGLLMLDSGTLSPLLKRLESSGFVQRRRAAADERQVLVTVTERGSQLRQEAEHAHAEVVRRLGLGPAELDELQRILLHVTTASMGAAPRV